MGNNHCSIQEICDSNNQKTGAQRRQSLSQKMPDIKFTQKDLVQIKKYSITKDYMIMNPPIGKGSFGCVYKIMNRLSGMIWVAKKIPLHPKMSKHLQQIYILKKLDHPNVVRIIDIYQQDKYIYVVMEYCSGGQLFDKIVQRKNMTEQIAKNLMKQILSAVSYCHMNRIIHRDLKPQNIMLISPKQDNIKIIDFGAGTISRQGQMNSTKVGSVYYIAPQVIKKSYNQKCDIWSCGVIMYMMLSGVPPFNAKTDQAIFDKILKGNYSFPQKKWKNISLEARQLISKMLEYDPQSRISSRQALNHSWFKNMKNQPKNLYVQNQLEKICQFCSMNKFKQCILVFIAHNLSQAEALQKMSISFKNIDKNNDGRISWRQFKRCYQENLGDFDQKKMMKLFSSLDKNESGYIDYSEFITYMMSKQISENKDMISRAFDLIDVNKDNKLQRKELLQALGGIDQQLFTQIMSECDLNQDGYISRQQFITGILQISKQKIESNKGIKTRAETKQI